ncbi:hypothetical protein BpHYR1_027190 [Brachionus plicatilis]|uniref:Uncharacterized protein n=1 Tax=Brachionus plicatilis TaxID=10195 RepID=A0A3M7Q440_BRAPC|nr:hypothetical protein BpHYR1_027190 [Brachionus plicatilis]
MNFRSQAHLLSLGFTLRRNKIKQIMFNKLVVSFLKRSIFTFEIALNSLTGRLPSTDLEISITRYRVPVKKRERKCNVETNLIYQKIIYKTIKTKYSMLNLIYLISMQYDREIKRKLNKAFACPSKFEKFLCF